MLAFIPTFDKIRFKTQKNWEKGDLLWPSMTFEVLLHLIKNYISVMLLALIFFSKSVNNYNFCSQKKFTFNDLWGQAL